MILQFNEDGDSVNVEYGEKLLDPKQIISPKQFESLITKLELTKYRLIEMINNLEDQIHFSNKAIQ